MIEIAYIGRNSPGKGVDFFFKSLDRVYRNDLRVHFFTDYLDNSLCEGLNVKVEQHGWISPEEVWLVDFDFVLIPMTAPETFSFILHESVKNNKGIIVNGCNESLTSQIIEGGIFFSSINNLSQILSNLTKSDVSKAKVKLNIKKTLWEKLN
jgi:glycosyltransferase involved in cell wall biosynthesis